MKKILLCLVIVFNLISLSVFADTTPTVFGTESAALNWADFSLGNKFTSVMQEVIDYIDNNTIGSYNKNTDLCILFPNQVIAWDNITQNYNIIFYFGYTSDRSSDVWGVISHNPTDNYWWTEATGPYNYCVGEVSHGSTQLPFWISYNNGTITVSPYSVQGSVDFSSLWSITATINGGKYLVANTKAGFNNKYGLAGSIYLNSPGDLIESLPCFDNYYAGWDTSNWNNRYIKNENETIVPWNIFTTSTDVYVQTDVIVSGNTIVFDGNNTDGVDFDINVDNIWSTLKYNVFNLLSGFQVVSYLFMVIFNWLPIEFITLIYSALILAVTLLIIKVLRGG